MIYGHYQAENIAKILACLDASNKKQHTSKKLDSDRRQVQDGVHMPRRRLIKDVRLTAFEITEPEFNSRKSNLG